MLRTLAPRTAVGNARAMRRARLPSPNLRAHLNQTAMYTSAISARETKE